MLQQLRGCAVVAVFALSAVPAWCQASAVVAKAKAESKTWTTPRTPDGHPDLQGTWSNTTLTPLERPADLAGKPYLTEQEAAEYEKRTFGVKSLDTSGHLGGLRASISASFASISPGRSAEDSKYLHPVAGSTAARSWASRAA